MGDEMDDNEIILMLAHMVEQVMEGNPEHTFQTVEELIHECLETAVEELQS